jgi:hypothetical protein
MMTITMTPAAAMMMTRVVASYGNPKEMTDFSGTSLKFYKRIHNSENLQHTT